MIPMSAWTLTVFSILGFSFSRDHQKESARALKMGSSDAYAGAVRRHHSRRVPSAEDSSLITGIGSSARTLVSVGGK